MKCPNCNKEFFQKDFYRLTFKKFCSLKCENEYNARDNPSKPKTLDDWSREANDCKLDYGTYRALIGMGKTFEELKNRN